MQHERIEIEGYCVDLYTLHTIIVGTGASGFNAADRLFDYGQRDIAIVTEGIRMGTSRNTGSDKQTYYKLTLSGSGRDSIRDLAQNLFDGGCMHGDLALCEAALSPQCFYKLVDIGVPFPHNTYGEYAGYKTDHDPLQRATSAGPLTSRFMTEKLEERVNAKNIRIFDGYKVIGILTENEQCIGLLALNKSELADKDKRFALFNCTNVVYATGGPAGLYDCSVYPESQTGASGIAFEAGVKGRNLTEWQYGIASIDFRWNLSGTYQQVLPRYVSTDREGNDAREFLDEYYPDATRMLDSIFLKGYQWPFDARKINDFGSSLIDILVYNEIHEKGRRVFLDYRANPSALKSDFSNLGNISYEYLKKSGALLSTPIDRLAHMNQPAVDLYRSNGIDLANDLLEIAVCAQHNNGGLAVNCWWETNLKHFFAVGEVAGTHGVYRPGGSALNSGQVGSTRAARFITKRYTEQPLSTADFISHVAGFFSARATIVERLFQNKADTSFQSKPRKDVRTIRSEIGNRMSRSAAHIRNVTTLSELICYCRAQLDRLPEDTSISSPRDLTAFFENYDLLIVQQVYAEAMYNYAANGGGSRGSYLIIDESGVSCNNNPTSVIPTFVPDNKYLSSQIQEVSYTPAKCICEWSPVRPIPITDDWFENIWGEYLRDEVVR